MCSARLQETERQRTLGDLLEGIALHALENKPPFKSATLEKIADLKRIYELKLKAEDSHQLRET